jgi:hypothetical protein
MEYRGGGHPREAEVIRVAVAASLDRSVGLAPVCEELSSSRSTVYAQRARAESYPWM